MRVVNAEIICQIIAKTKDTTVNTSVDDNLRSVWINIRMEEVEECVGRQKRRVTKVRKKCEL